MPKPTKIETIYFSSGASFDVPADVYKKAVQAALNLGVDNSDAEGVATAQFLGYYRQMIRVMSIEHADLLVRVRDLIHSGIKDGLRLQPTMTHLMNLVSGVGNSEDLSTISMFMTRALREEGFINVPDMDVALNDHRIIGVYLLRSSTMKSLDWEKVV